MKRLIMASITAVVVIIVLAGTLIPILDDATATEDTFTNEGYFYVQKLGVDDDPITLSWDVSSPNTMMYNSTVIDISGWPNNGYTVATDGEGWIVRMGTATAVRMQTMGASWNMGGGATAKSLSVTFDSGTATATFVNTSNVSSTAVTSYTDLYIISPTETDYVMKKANAVAYIDDDDQYLAMGVTTVTQWNTVIKVTGNYSTFDAEIVFPTGVTTTTTNKNMVITEDSDHEDLYVLDKLTFTVNDGTSTVNATYSYFIVPAKVTAERAIHFTDGENAIFNAIPVMVIIALLLGVVALVLRSRMD